VLHRPERRALRFVAPLPPHIKALLNACRWSLPSHDLAPPTAAPLGGWQRRGAARAGRGGARKKRVGGGLLTKRAFEQWYKVGKGRG